jgi:excisionase family DNA binding protein
MQQVMVMTDALLWSIAETARQLGGVSERTVQRLLQSGELPTVNVRGRRKVPSAAVRAWVAKQLGSVHTDEAGLGVEETTCHTDVTILPTGGSATATQAAKKLAKVLKLPATLTPKR